MIGPSITGILIAAFGGAIGFGLAAVASYLALLLYGQLRVDGAPRPHDGRHVLHQFAEGLGFVAHDFVFACLIGMALFNSLFAMSYLTHPAHLRRRVLRRGLGGLRAPERRPRHRGPHRQLRGREPSRT